MRADATAKWTVADDLPGSPRLPARCKQRVPGGQCTEQVDYVCDHCSKVVCLEHRRSAIMPRLAERDRQAAEEAGTLLQWPRDGHGDLQPPGRRNPDEPAPDLCITCQHLEENRGVAIEEISADARRAFLLSDPAADYIGEHECAEFPELREHHGRIHGKARKP